MVTSADEKAERTMAGFNNGFWVTAQMIHATALSPDDKYGPLWCIIRSMVGVVAEVLRGSVSRDVPVPGAGSGRSGKVTCGWRRPARRACCCASGCWTSGYLGTPLVDAVLEVLR